MRDTGTQRIELIRALEELHNFLEFLFFLVLTGHIGKGSSLFVLVLVLYLGLATFMMPPPPAPPRIMENSRKPVQPSIAR